jgi:cell division protein ZapD
MQGKIGHYLRENDWLMSIKSRASIPGGVCEFDLPSYHYWLHRDPGAQRDLAGWLNPMLPIRDGLAIVLRLLRASGRQEEQVAQHGAYQLMLGGRTAQMVRLRLGATNPTCPRSAPTSTPSTSASPPPAPMPVRARPTATSFLK